jgi:putative PEP-CTERM system histidine kinase
MHDGFLVGIVKLERPAEMGMLTFEDHDLLRTAGQQVAIFLAQERAQEQLLQTRQFEAFSKLTAFLMHDLKNLVAQQELVVGNARRFKHRPEFVDDAISTIEASVRRMKSVLERLAAEDSLQPVTRVDLRKLLMDVSFACADRSPSPRLQAANTSLAVQVDRDKLSMAVTHAVRNAQDATPADGKIEIRLLASGDEAVIEVADSGCGMDATFIREHLFRPFDRT